MLAGAVAMRFILYGLVAVGLYTGYQYYHLTPGTSSLSPPSSHLHTSGSLGVGTMLPDGRASISRRTVAVADLHGDLQHALNVLSMASIISAPSSASIKGDGWEYEWVGGHDVLVSTGDIVDRGDDTIALYRLFMSLRKQAERSGGQVKNLLGNHEIMNAIGDWRYVTAGDIKTFGGVQERRHAMSDQGWIGNDWLDNYNVTASIALLPTNHPHLPAGYTPPQVSFVHGGITPEYASLGIDYINTLAKSFLRKGLSDPSPGSFYPTNTTDDEKHLWSEHGPLWYRGYATDPANQACLNAANATKALHVRHLVMGHTPHFDGFVTRCKDAAILLIDTGISRAYGGEQSALVIDFDLTPLQAPELHGTKLWSEKETLTALYKGRRPKILTTIERQLWL